MGAAKYSKKGEGEPVGVAYGVGNGDAARVSALNGTLIDPGVNASVNGMEPKLFARMICPIDAGTPVAACIGYESKSEGGKVVGSGHFDVLLLGPLHALRAHAAPNVRIHIATTGFIIARS